MSILNKSIEQRYAELELEVTCSCGATTKVGGPEIRNWNKGNKFFYSRLGIGFFCPHCFNFVNVSRDIEKIDKELVNYINKKRKWFTSVEAI